MTELLPLNNSHLPMRLTVDAYLLLDESGLFAEYAKTELIDGEILYMNAQHRPHARIKSRLFRAICDQLDEIGGLEAIVEGSIGIPPYNSPEPDIVVTNDPEGTGLIPIDSVKLVVEVSDATLNFDVRQKLSLYARFGIAEYWVVDVNARMILIHSGPAGDNYTLRTMATFGDRITAATIPGLTVSTDGL